MTIQEQVAEAKRKEGFYIVNDSQDQRFDVPIVSLGGKLYSMKIDEPLRDEGWNDTAKFHGPYRPNNNE